MSFLGVQISSWAQGIQGPGRRNIRATTGSGTPDLCGLGPISCPKWIGKAAHNHEAWARNTVYFFIIIFFPFTGTKENTGATRQNAGSESRCEWCTPLVLKAGAQTLTATSGDEAARSCFGWARWVGSLAQPMMSTGLTTQSTSGPWIANLTPASPPLEINVHVYWFSCPGTPCGKRA